MPPERIAYRKPVEIGRFAGRQVDDSVDPRQWWPLVHHLTQLLDRGWVTLGKKLDRTVMKITNPPVEAVAPRLLHSPIAEAYALNAPFDADTKHHGFSPVAADALEANGRRGSHAAGDPTARDESYVTDLFTPGCARFGKLFDQIRQNIQVDRLA